MVYNTYTQVSLSDEFSDISLYPDGHVTYVSYDTEEHVENNEADIMLAVGKLFDLYSSMNELEPIQIK